jgi:hypothetical protein
MITSIPETLHICDGCQDQLVEGRTDRIGNALCAGCEAYVEMRQIQTIDRMVRELEQAKQDLARARRNTRRAIWGLICGPGLAALGILALPYLFRAVFFLEHVLGAQP